MDYQSVQASAWLSRKLTMDDVTYAAAIVPKQGGRFEIYTTIPRLMPKTEMVFDIEDYIHVNNYYLAVGFVNLLCRETDFIEGPHDEVVNRYYAEVMAAMQILKQIKDTIGYNYNDYPSTRMFYIDRALIRRAVPVIECEVDGPVMFTHRTYPRHGIKQVDMKIEQVTFEAFTEEIRRRDTQRFELYEGEHQMTMLSELSMKFPVGIKPGQYQLTYNPGKSTHLLHSDDVITWHCLDEDQPIPMEWLYIASPVITLDPKNQVLRYWLINPA